MLYLREEKKWSLIVPLLFCHQDYPWWVIDPFSQELASLLSFLIFIAPDRFRSSSCTIEDIMLLLQGSLQKETSIFLLKSSQTLSKSKYRALMFTSFVSLLNIFETMAKIAHPLLQGSVLIICVCHSLMYTFCLCLPSSWNVTSPIAFC